MSAETASGPTEDQVEILEYNFCKVNRHPDPATLCLIAAEAGLSEEETQVSGRTRPARPDQPGCPAPALGPHCSARRRRRIPASRLPGVPRLLLRTPASPSRRSSAKRNLGEIFSARCGQSWKGPSGQLRIKSAAAERKFSSPERFGSDL
ncbi:Homeodomain-only protein [Tupaia chinensis]|uniref:Homeodomain-only protein n=1 Tax=Tupaia chinensis TaxID=246437 RepID=L8Y9R2_TUPCH|nr:Homeodomain-only protein [Tupaia chinensis]